MKWPMTEYRASFDATVTFANGGGLAAHGFRVDVPSPGIDEAGIASLFVASLGLLMTESVELANVEIIAELLAAGIPVVEHLTGLGQLPPAGAWFHRRSAADRGIRHHPGARVRAAARVGGATRPAGQFEDW